MQTVRGLEPKQALEARHAQQPQAILGEALGRFPHRTQAARFEIAQPTFGVAHLVAQGIEENRIAREVSPARVLLERRSVADFIRPPAVAVARLTAERRHFDVARRRHDDHGAERTAHREGAREQALDLIGRGRCRDVDFLWITRQSEVANGATHDPARSIASRESLGDEARRGDEPRVQIGHRRTPHDR